MKTQCITAHSAAVKQKTEVIKQDSNAGNSHITIQSASQQVTKAILGTFNHYSNMTMVSNRFTAITQVNLC